MTLDDLFQSSLQSLARTKARSLMTMLGIVIGVMSVILTLSIGEAAQRFILNQISSFGSDTLFLVSGAAVDRGTPSLFIKETLTLRDIKRMQIQPWVDRIAGLVFQQDQVQANGETKSTQVIGTMPDEVRFSDIHLSKGEFISTSDVDGRTKTAVIGSDVAKKLFGADDPLGKSIRISDTGFRVIGIIEAAGTKAFQNYDNRVYIPVTAGLDLYNKKYLTYATVRTRLPIADAVDRVRIAMREYHSIDNPTGDLAKDDFHIQTQEDVAKTTGNITNILQILLISIAAISLLVGGIGIMNIMYVSVTERIREIGLRKSIGARSRDVLRQFLVEAVLQSVLGGAIGTLLGITLSWIGIQIISQYQTGWSFAVSPTGIALGISVSAAIGIVFGYFPARRAAQLTPIQALSFE